LGIGVFWDATYSCPLYGDQVGARCAQRIGMSWMIVSTIGAILTGFVGIAYFAHQG